jgi:glutaredoxin-related protein
MGDKVILFSTHCPRCKVLELKLKQKNIQYEENTDIEQMKAKGFKEVPKLEVNGVIYDFKEAVKWIGEQ